MKSFDKYSEKNIQIYANAASSFMMNSINGLFFNKCFTLCDLGCGDGAVLVDLHDQGLLENAGLCVAIDLSPKRIEKIKNLNNIGLNVKGIVSDACSVGQLNDKIFDFIVCSQVIEHVPDDKKLLLEIRRLLKKDGYVYISSVIKKRHGFWIYRNGGRWVLDPTHLREYASQEEFQSLLRSANFKTIKVNISPCKFPLLDMVIKALIILGLPPDKARDIYLKHNNLNIIRTVKLSVPGYYIIEVIAANST